MSVMVQSIVPTSAAPALALLEETEPILQAHALFTLDTLADSFWPEISGAVDKIQELSENTSFPEKDLASLVVAKVLFHLGELDEAVRYALAAGRLFDVDADTEFANTLRARCIDEYIALRMGMDSSVDKAGPSTEPRAALGVELLSQTFADELKAVVERVLQGCIANGEINEAIGIAIESHRLDKLEEVILQGCPSNASCAAALEYCFDCAQTLIASRQYRTSVLKLVSSIHMKRFTAEDRNHLAVANCLAFTKDFQGVADVLMDLVADDKTRDEDSQDERELIALQIAFDIVENDEPHFAAQVASVLPKVPEVAPAENADALAAQEEPEDLSNAAEAETGDDAMETDSLLPSAGVTDAEPKPKAETPAELTPAHKKIAKLQTVLSGQVTAELSLNFLCSQNRSDLYLMKKIKQALDARSSVSHSALIFSNAIAHGGTAIDTFLRENLDWLARATAWAKFSATSCLGVIHARHTSSALILLSPYLPPAGGASSSSSASAFSEGGALYALGLIVASGGRDVALPNSSGGATDARLYLLQSLRNASSNEVVQHGACLGLGLSGMASWNGSGENEMYEELKNVLAADSAVASEGAGLAIGLLCLGSGSSRVCTEMFEYALETQHDKISRGLAMGMALISYGREDDADDLIEKMTADNDPILRYGGMYAVALAYCGTGDNKAIRRLLHSAVSDLSDDVRRAAVIAIGFVLFRHPKQVPRIVSLLSESCHAHVRYGAALAIGIACVGTGLSAAIEILERLTTDPTDFVRQGAFIGLALVFMHHTEARSPKAAEIRKLFEATMNAKLEDAVTRFGAVIASGLIDAGGRNGSISLSSSTGHRRMSTIVGLAMFTQFWYWFPLVHFIGLSIKPSALIGITKELKMPKFKVVSDAAPALYDYLPSGPPEKVKEIVRVPTAVLSVTAKSKAREMRRQAAKAKENVVEMEVDSGGTAADVAVEDGAKSKTIEKKTEDSAESQEPNSFAVLNNPCRVISGQEQYIKWEFEKGDTKIVPRYVPVKSNRSLATGIMLLRDLKSSEPEEFECTIVSTGGSTQAAASDVETPGQARLVDADSDPEVAPPCAFVYTDEDPQSEEQDDK